MGIQQRYERTLGEVRAWCEQCGRNLNEVTLVAVSKTVDAAGVGEAFAAGARNFAENRPDQIVPKAAAYPDATWHFIGNIQSRRIPDIVGSAALIHSLFQLKHAEKINAAAKAADKVQDVLIEVNVSGEESKSGVAPDEAAGLVSACAQLECVRVRGLMTMAPQGDPQVARACFEGLASLRGRIRAGLSEPQAVCFDELSMGMSEDWREAICAGATIVRVGRAIFSDSFE